MITIAVTAVGGGVGQAVLRALAGSVGPMRTVGLDTRPLAPGLYWTNSGYLVPPVARTPEYVERLIGIVRREGVDLLIPGLDAELAILANSREALRDAGCEVVVGSVRSVTLCRDKLALARFLAETGLPFAPTFSLSEAHAAPGDLPFPLIAKPRRGEASRRVRLVRDEAELGSLPEGEEFVLQRRLLKEGVRKGDPWRQEDEWSVQAFVSARGEILGHLTTVHHLKQGVPWEIRPVADTGAFEAARPIIEALAEEGLEGPINLQGIQEPDGLRFFEANARFTGVTAVRHAAGYREVDAAIHAFLLGDEAAAKRCLWTSPRPVVAATHFVETVIRADQVRSPADPEPAPSPPPKTVLVTGASGYAGANLVSRLLSEPGIEGVRAGVRDEEAGERLIRRLGSGGRLRFDFGNLPCEPWPLGGVDAVVHLAGLRAAPDGDPGPLYAVNAEGTRRLAAAAREAGVSRFVLASTQAVYGTRRPPPWSEVLPTAPETPYAASKVAAEELLGGFSGEMDVVVLRIARLYGRGLGIRWGEMPHLLARQAVSGDRIRLLGGGRARLDLLHVFDFVNAVVASLRAPTGPGRTVLNIGGGAPIRVADLARICLEEAAATGCPESPVETIPGGPDSYPDFGMDTSRARLRLGFSAGTPVAEGIRDLVAHLREEAESVLT